MTLSPRIAARLRAARPFARLAPGTLAQLLEYAHVESLAPGATLFREGEISEFVHFVLDGSVGLAASAEKREGTIIEIFREDETFVAAAAILRLPYLVSAVALSRARVVAIPAAVFRSVLGRDAAFAREMVDVLAHHWRLLVEQLKDLKLRPTAERLAVYLLVHADAPLERRAVSLALREPRKALAARLNMTPESLSRAFVLLRQHGVSNASGGGVRIGNLMRLRRFAYGALAGPASKPPRRRGG